MKHDSVFVLLTAFGSETPQSICAAFTSRQKTERFVKVQQGISFPYKRWAIEECELQTVSDAQVETIFVLMAEEKEGEPYRILLAFENEEDGETHIKELESTGEFPNQEYELMEVELD